MQHAPARPTPGGALRVLNMIDFPKTHDLNALARLMPSLLMPLRTDEERRRLTEYATLMRYPGDYGPRKEVREGRSFDPDEVAIHTRHQHAAGLMRIFNKLCQQPKEKGLPKAFLWSFWPRLGFEAHALIAYRGSLRLVVTPARHARYKSGPK